MGTIILSQTMEAFIASGVPEFGGEKPFTLSHDDMDFEAVSWWNLNEYMTVGVVLTESRNLLYAIMAMHNYITDEWDKASKEYRQTDNHESIDVLLGFGYRMALIIPPSIGKGLMRYARPYDLEMHMVMDDKTVYTRLPNGDSE